MRIPFIGGAIAKSFMLIDPANAQFYALNQLPITSVATVRMQNEAWESQAFATSAVAPVVIEDTGAGQFVNDTQTPGAVTPCADEYGLTAHTALMSAAGYATGEGVGGGVCGYNAALNGNSSAVLNRQIQSVNDSQINPVDDGGALGGDECD